MSGIKVEYIDSMGTDERVLNAARISNDKDVDGTNDRKRNVKLMNYLAKNRHMTPFEHCVLTVMITCPLFIRSQIMRHRTFSYNEVSRRYTSENIEFYLPTELHMQDIKNKQASSSVHERSGYWLNRMSEHIEASHRLYEEMLADNVSREEARGILPQDLETRFYMTGNLRNWIHFIKLRKSSHAQVESQYIAAEAENILKQKFPHATTYLMYWNDDL